MYYPDYMTNTERINLLKKFIEKECEAPSIAEVFHFAADYCLAVKPTEYEKDITNGRNIKKLVIDNKELTLTKQKFSCLAVYTAFEYLVYQKNKAKIEKYVRNNLRDMNSWNYGEAVEEHPLKKCIQKGLKNMGLNINSCNAYKDQRGYDFNQSARYTWLKFAAMMAEEQGV